MKYEGRLRKMHTFKSKYFKNDLSMEKKNKTKKKNKKQNKTKQSSIVF